MEKKDLIITISGQAKSGKSRLIFLLKKFLREQDFEVKHELNFDFPTEFDFDKFIGQNFDGVIKNFKKTRKIIIKEEQLDKRFQ